MAKRADPMPVSYPEVIAGSPSSVGTPSDRRSQDRASLVFSPASRRLLQQVRRGLFHVSVNQHRRSAHLALD